MRLKHDARRALSPSGGRQPGGNDRRQPDDPLLPRPIRLRPQLARARLVGLDTRDVVMRYVIFAVVLAGWVFAWALCRAGAEADRDERENRK